MAGSRKIKNPQPLFGGFGGFGLYSLIAAYGFLEVISFSETTNHSSVLDCFI